MKEITAAHAGMVGARAAYGKAQLIGSLAAFLVLGRVLVRVGLELGQISVRRGQLVEQLLVDGDGQHRPALLVTAHDDAVEFWRLGGRLLRARLAGGRSGRYLAWAPAGAVLDHALGALPPHAFHKNILALIPRTVDKAAAALRHSPTLPMMLGLRGP